MADILIRMEMPKHCFLCRFFREVQDYDGTFDCCMLANKEINSEFDGCRPFFLPEGHGRLIDADALIKAMFTASDGTIMRDTNIDGWSFEMRYKDIKRYIKNAPTIVPAEGGTDNG